MKASDYFVVGDFVTLNPTAKINTTNSGNIAVATSLGDGVVYQVASFHDDLYLKIDGSPGHYLPKRFYLCTEDGTIIEPYPY